METQSVLLQEQMTTVNQTISDYELLSVFFVYPEDENFRKKIDEGYRYLISSCPEAAEAMKPFIEFMNVSTLPEIQELFLRSFDVQAITTLDIGFTLFGEDFKRGQLLVNLNREHREAGNICYTELSDHLTNVIRLLPKMKNVEMRNEIALRLLIPAVEKMIGEFNFKKIEKKDEIYKKNLKTIIDYSAQYRTVYQTLLQALFIILRKDFGYESVVTVDAVENPGHNVDGMSCGSCSFGGATPGDYTRNIETEMTIEKY